MIEAFAQSMTQLPIERNCVMSKVSFERREYRGEKIQYEALIVKQTMKRVQIQCMAIEEGEVVATLNVQLFMKIPSNSAYSGQDKQGQFLYQFSKEEVYEFSHRVEDENLLHLGKKPVVQGMLILKMLLKYFKEVRQLEIKFVAPLLAHEKLYLAHEIDKFYGLSEGRLCFKGTYQANKKEGI